MCLAILKTKGSKITKDELLECWETNDDGGGYAFAKDGKLFVKRSLDKDEFISSLLKSIKTFDANYLIHFRIATSGTIDMLSNCHPFAIDRDNVFCHNGVMNNVQSNDKISDTRFFNKDILKQMKFDFKNHSHLKLIEEFIGIGNKMIFLNKSGHYKIANEGIGTWQNGVWFSNLNHSCNYNRYHNVKTYEDWYEESTINQFQLRPKKTKTKKKEI